MTIQEAITKVNLLRPNHIPDEQKVNWLSELDGMIHREIVLKHEHPAELDTFGGYDGNTDPNTKLLAPFPYDELYTYYLFAQCDLTNLEIQKYNNDKTLFNNAYDTLSDYWTRTYMPISRIRELML